VITFPDTDHKTVTWITLSGECLLLQNTLQFNIEEIVRLIGYCFKSGFVDETTKPRLWILALSTTLKVLRVNWIDISPIRGNPSYSFGLGIRHDAAFAP
jgi:hypothetical protein